MKTNKALEKQYIEKKRFEYFSENQFEQNNSCLFKPFSPEEFLISSHFGVQDPQQSIKLLISYYILPLFASDEIFQANIDNIENFILFCAPIQLEICAELLDLYEKKMRKLNTELNFIVLIMEILYLTIKFNDIRQPMQSRKNCIYQEFDKETNKICKTLIRTYLKINKNVAYPDEIKFLKNAIIYQFYLYKFFDLVLEIYKLFENTNISEHPNFLKAFLKPLLIESNKKLMFFANFTYFRQLPLIFRVYFADKRENRRIVHAKFLDFQRKSLKLS